MTAPDPLRRPTSLLVGSLFVLVLHEVLVRAMAHGHVAHALLGAGNAAPPLAAALLAVTLVVVRVAAIVVVPGAVAWAAVGFAAHALTRRRAGPTPQGAGSSSGAGSSVAGGTGTSIGAGGTE